MYWKENINSIKEIFKGHYQILLDFASVKFIPFIIDENYKFCWIVEHTTSDYTSWKNSKLPISSSADNIPVLARHISYD